MEKEKRRFNSFFESDFRWDRWNREPVFLVCVGTGIASAILYYCGKSADTAPVNTYTQNHRNFNVFLTWSAFRLTFLVLFFQKLREYRLIKYVCIQWLLAPFVYLLRLAAVVWFVYFFLWKELIPFVIHSVRLNRINWWHSKDEPWLTNCSFVNAFFCWILWPVLMLILLWCSLFVLVSVLFAPCNRRKRRDLVDIFETLWDLLY